MIYLNIHNNLNQKTLIITQHGWGLDKNIFFQILNISNHFSDYFHLDSCYFKERCNYSSQIEELQNLIDKNKYTNIIGIGHSIGFIKLLNLIKYHNIKFDQVISLAGFLKFNVNRISEIKLQKTKEAFLNNPKELIKNFNCIINNKKALPNIDFINFEKLITDLNNLFIMDYTIELNLLKNISKKQHFYDLNDKILTEHSINEQLQNTKNIFFEEFKLQNVGHFNFNITAKEV